MIWLAYSIIGSLPFYLAVFGTVVISILIYIKSILQKSSTIPKLYFKESALASHLLKRCRLMNRKFDPPWWISNAHVQTILPFLLPSEELEYDREYLQMKDRGVVALDWVVQVSIHKRKRCTILLVIPGFTANALSVSKLCGLAAHKGYRPVVFNPRGFGNSNLTTAKLLSYGDPTDLRQVIKYIHGCYPKALITMIGYGNGCSLLLSYLGEYGSSANICAGACISACFDYTERFSKDKRGMYDLLYLSKLKCTIGAHSKALSNKIDLNELLRAWSYRRFDEVVYSKMYGFSNVEEFWERNNPLRDVDEIAVPLLFINSLDDPFYSNIKIPYELCKYYPQFLMVATEKGGHCSFTEKICDVTWAEKLAIDYIDSVLEFTNKGHTIKYGKSPSRSTI
ncbi:protein ABHD15-like [Ruditapes philippinarum]|uniref:protein ABHD15-like n=1 Tax=Ruditapes philippinarum TaxID=129788 RepID=UPI00295BF916|nr:protein ABHD15-like [Ruditapes philippinarum]XP_060570233.1 protein ABHD15-like [Ruditapes philippinarum]XP_060570235.1 protein ABHD15-like [Ruditapes philippinarum]XP_060570236.1 protein ABHD15-like [Ruditapes philippinarum]